MRINPVSEYKTNNQVAFQKGLTQGFIEKANKLNYKKIKKLAKKKGIETVLFDGKLSVAASCLAAAEIMQSLGLKLPKKFSFEPLPEDTSGRCIYPDETIQMNSNVFPFRGLLSQDTYETYRLGTPLTKHFLNTYIHEFMHAANDANISKNRSVKESLHIMRFLQRYTPTKEILDPIVLRPVWEIWEPSWNDNSILGKNASKDLMEFFADNATFEITLFLSRKNNALGENSGDNVFFNPKGKKPLTLSFLEDKKDSWWDRTFNKREVVRRNLLKAIWEGDINTILIKYGEYIRLKKD